MSFQQAPDPLTDLGRCRGLATVISPRPRDLGGFEAVSYTHLTLPTILRV